MNAVREVQKRKGKKFLLMLCCIISPHDSEMENQKKAYLSLIKGQEEVRRPRKDAPRAINEVIPGGNRIRVGFQHGGSLHQLGARILHPVVSGKEKINDWEWLKSMMSWWICDDGNTL